MAKEAGEKQKKSAVDLSSYSVEEALDVLNKLYGENTVVLADNAEGAEIQHIPTGSYALDFALGGGFPKNRVTEIRGQFSSFKSTICLLALANFQRSNPQGMGIYVDAEKSFDRLYAKRLGVDLKRLLLVNPDSGEQAADVVSALTSMSVDLFMIIDSVAALVPTAELVADMQDAMMGTHARLVGRMFRVLTARMKRNLYDDTAASTTVLAINQLRQKIGVMFGCGRAKNTIPFVDGTCASIRDVVEKRISKKVWAYDQKSQKFVPAKITNWFTNGTVEKASDFIHIHVKPLDSVNGRQGAQFTRTHKVLTSKGWKEAQHIKVGDMLVSQYSSWVHGPIKQFILGMLMGDSHLCGGRSTKAIQLADHSNPEYVAWKRALLEPAFSFRSHLLHNKRTQRSYTVWTSDYSSELGLLKVKLGRRDPSAFLEEMDLLSFAVWYMDDGNYSKNGSYDSYHTSISLKRFRGNRQVLSRVSRRLLQLGFSTTVNVKYGSILFSVASARKFHRAIRKYVPACMQYKLPADCRGYYSDFNFAPLKPVIQKHVVPVVRVNVGRKGDPLTKYDIEVAGYSNYLTGGSSSGFVVHNSPETTPGGLAKDFYYSVIVRMSASVAKEAVITEDSTVNGVTRSIRYGQRVDFKVLKNKCGGPQHEEGEFMWYERPYKDHAALSINNLDALFNFGAFYNVITQGKGSKGAGGAYSCKYLSKAFKSPAGFIKYLGQFPKAQYLLYSDILQAMKPKTKEQPLALKFVQTEESDE